MPIESPVSPRIFRRMLEIEGFQLVRQDSLNWAFFKDGCGLIHPVILPHTVELVPLEIMSRVLDVAKITPGLFQQLLDRIKTEPNLTGSA